MPELDRFIISNRLWMVNHPVGVPIYDFDFRSFFDCRTPFEARGDIPAVARIGAFQDYGEFFERCGQMGINLLHSPADHSRCSHLPEWYPLIENHTPRSKWYDRIPTLAKIEEDFEFPVFLKGARQTSKHQAAASIVRGRADFENAVAIFRSDPILHWQEFVCRELLELRPVPGSQKGKIPASFEFRTFWWKGNLVGSGRYWFEAGEYSWTPAESDEALMVARHAVRALNRTFLVVDLAQTVDGRWIVIECNDGMESGYAGASPFAIWQAVLQHECS